MIRLLEFFCGIGGCTVALGARATVSAAVDIHQGALEIYRRNHGAVAHARTIESLSSDELRRWPADLWWLSPPCQPYTVRGLQRDLDDPRSAAFRAVIERLTELRPRAVALENVPGFQGSAAHELLGERLTRLGYHVRELLLCPTELGVPNRRRRFYLVADLQPFLPPPPRPHYALRLSDVLEAVPRAELHVPEALRQAYAQALHVVSADDPAAVTSCFTAAYGRSPVRSGSYLRTTDGLRRFSPDEILRLLGFPSHFVLPDWPLKKLWPLVGNSLSIYAVRHVLAHLRLS